MTPLSRSRIERALASLESIRRAECESPVNYSVYRAAIEGAAMLECVLEDDDEAEENDDPDDRDPTVNEMLDRGEL